MKCLPLIAKLVFSWHVLKKSVLTAGTAENQIPKLRITNAKLYIPVVTLSTQDKIKLLKQFESGFKRTINWNKYKFNKTSQVQNRYLDILIDASFQGVNCILFYHLKMMMVEKVTSSIISNCENKRL